MISSESSVVPATEEGNDEDGGAKGGGSCAKLESLKRADPSYSLDAIIRETRTSISFASQELLSKKKTSPRWKFD